MALVDPDRVPVSAEIEAVREIELFRISEHEAQEEYDELHQGNRFDEYDPVAIFGTFPYLSTGGRITVDLMDFTSSEARFTELGYFRRILKLPPMDAPSAPLIKPELAPRMRELAMQNKASAVLVFSRDSVRLFYASGIPPVEALDQIKSSAELGIRQQS